MRWVFWASKANAARKLLVWEDQRLIPGAWLAAPLEPTVCSLALLNTARWEARANPDSLIQLFMYLAPHHPFHLACCVLTPEPGPGLTNRSQINASHVPQGASLKLILASPWSCTVGECAKATVRHLHVWVSECTRISSQAEIVAAHRSSNAARISESTGTSFVSLEGKQLGRMVS